MTRLFPGSRWVWLGALVVALLASALLARTLLARTAPLTGTNSVGVASVIATVPAGTETCIRDLVIPEGTRRIGVSAGAVQVKRGATVDAFLLQASARTPLVTRDLPSGLGPYELTLPAATEERLERATVCLTPRRTGLDFGGAFVQRRPRAPRTSVAGRPLGRGDISVRYLRASGEAPRVIEVLPSALRRATLFESPAGRVLLWLALPLLLLCPYVVVRVAATADAVSVRRLAVLAASLAFVHGATWAVLLHPFHGPDESEHFAYAQHLAATNDQPDKASVSRQSAYSGSQLRLMEALHHNSTILNATSRLRWDPFWSEAYERDARGARDDNGGGGSESATGHGPLYYGVIGLPYRALNGTLSLPGTLLAMRLLNALLAAVVAGLAVLTAGKILRGRHRAVSWAAGVLIAVQPVYGAVAGSVNNDTAVNLAAATLLFGLVWSAVDGPTWRRGALIGLAAITLPIAKITGFGILPVLAPAFLVVLLRHGLRATAPWATAGAATAALGALLWVFALSPALGGDRGSLVNVHTPGVTGPGAPAFETAAPPPEDAPVTTLLDRGEYFAQTFLPSPLFERSLWDLPGADAIERSPLFYIYVERGYGLFGWRSADLRPGLLKAIAGGLTVGWTLALVALVRRRRSWRAWGGPVLILASALVSALGFVAYAYAGTVTKAEAGEQGRYAFTAILSLAILFSGSLLALGGRLRAFATGAMTSAAASLALLAWVSALRSWFI